MTGYDFIFSEKRKTKLARHFTFWGIYCFTNFYAGLEPESINSFSDFALYKNALLNIAFFLPAAVLSAYSFIYLLMPMFIKPKKYLAFTIGAFLVICIAFIIDYFINLFILLPLYPGMFSPDFYQSSIQEAYSEAVHKGLTVCACAMGIKLAKNVYLQQIENTKLIKIGAANKIKLLKSNIQPEFLFHSLNNLHKKIKQSPDEAPEIVLQLSEIFSYILYDSAEEKTTLAKELSVIEHLIAIEKTSGNNLKVSADITGNSSGKYISPLILFSILKQLFIEGENTIRNNTAGIHAAVSIRDELLYLSMQFKNVSDDNRIKTGIKDLVTELQKKLPSGYMQYEKEEKDEIAIIIGLL